MENNWNRDYSSDYNRTNKIYNRCIPICAWWIFRITNTKKRMRKFRTQCAETLSLNDTGVKSKKNPEPERFSQVGVWLWGWKHSQGYLKKKK